MKLHRVSPGESRRWIEDGRPRWNGNKSMDDAIRHDDFVVDTSLAEGFPLEVLEHFGHTMPLIVVSLHKAGSPSLYHVDAIHKIFGMGILDRQRKF